MNSPRDGRWLPNFRRACGYLWPHRRAMFIGLLAAAGVSVFYTFSISSIVPVLKIIFAEHETLVDWLHRAEAQRRLGVVLAPDLPDDPRGLAIVEVWPSSANAQRLGAGDRILVIAGQPVSSYEAGRVLAAGDETHIADVRVLGLKNLERNIDLALRPHQWWWSPAYRAARALPGGADAEQRLRTLLLVMAAVVAISTLGAACRFINEGLVAVAVQRAMHGLRTHLAEHTLRLPLAWHSTQPPGDVLSRFATDISKVEVGVNTVFGKVVREPLKAVGVLTLTLLLDWHMLVVGALGLPVGVVFIRLFGKLIKRAQRRASESWGRLLDHLGERLAGVRIVKAYNMQAAESRRFATEDRVLTRAQTHIELVDAASTPVLETLAAVAISAFILYGGTRVFHRELEPHLFFGAVICLGGIFDPLRKMGNVYNRLQAAEASARRLFDLLNLPTEEDISRDGCHGRVGREGVGSRTADIAAAPSASATAGAEPGRYFAATADTGVGRYEDELPPLSREIELRDVWFAYPTNPERPVLAEVNLRVQKGQVVALVGPNGSGKTTLVSLLLRFFEPTRGRICIDGRDIADVSLAALRAQFGLVTQEAVVFSDTIRANIAYGVNGRVPDEAAIQRAARLAHADDFITLLRVERDGRITTGYDAEINARTLSGGQRQRLVLARAILRDPPILILDEATSQVDSESEQKIHAAIEDVMRNRTTFIIAHRYSTIARADLIVVLNEGRLVGLGRHDDLLRTCDFYATLVKTQFAYST